MGIEIEELAAILLGLLWSINWSGALPSLISCFDPFVYSVPEVRAKKARTQDKWGDEKVRVADDSKIADSSNYIAASCSCS